VTLASIRVLAESSRHLVSRFSSGVTPALTKQVRAAGGARQWFEAQLDPSSIGDPAATDVQSWFPDILYSPETLWRRHQQGVVKGYQVRFQFGCRTLMRRIYSTRQVHEVMTDFWSNLLHVPLGDEESWMHRFEYDAMIRKHALGRFDEMLVKAIPHPAMGLYLNNAVSTKDRPNENLGRELLELHTVGLDAGYTERDVRHSAHLLTGYLVDRWNTFSAYYSTEAHYTGTIRVLGFTHPNTSRDGRPATTAYLRYLAHHPATARRIAHRLCVRFVGDEPPGELVTAVAGTFQRSGTDIRATLRTLVDHPLFYRGARTKARTPIEDFVASARVLGVRTRKPTRDKGFPRGASMQCEKMGQTPFGWPAPNGSPESSSAWIGAGRVISSFGVHLDLVTGTFPRYDVTYQEHTHWLPALPARFDEVVDHMSRMVLGMPAGDRLKWTISQRLGIEGRQLVGGGDLPEHRVIPMLQLMLDSPTHMTR